MKWRWVEEHGAGEVTWYALRCDALGSVAHLSHTPHYWYAWFVCGGEARLPFALTEEEAKRIVTSTIRAQLESAAVALQEVS